MKHIIVALSLAALAAPAIADSSAPYEQTQFDRGLQGVEYQSASAGSTKADADAFANDHNFIAPAK